MTTLSSDRPSTDPNDDLFGHAPFAQSLADSICRHHGSDGMVLALYGPWGSGKSTVLSYVRHFLEQRPEAERPVIIIFNPWWFSGQENLARAFLGQLQAVLPGKSEKFKKLGDLLSDFAEGNPVDFIAIKALRVFMPAVYNVVRSNQDQFAGHRSGGHDAYDEKVRQAFHDAWIKEIPDDLRESTMSLLRRIFPKLENTTYGADWVAEWRKKQRVCVPELFPTYFRLAIAPGTIRRSEMVALLDLADTPDLLGQALVNATLEKRADGISKVRALLERLMDYVPKDIPDERIETFINVLLDVGDQLILPSNPMESFDFGNESRVTRIVYHLLKRLDNAQRLTLLCEAFKQGQGIGVQCYLLGTLSDENVNQAAGGNEALMDVGSLDALKAIWLDKIRTTEDNQLLVLSQLPRILFRWNAWGSADEVRAWSVRATETDDGLMTFLPHFCSHTRSQTMGDYAVRIQPRLNPNHLEKYLDTEAVAARLAKHQQAGTIPEQAKESVTQYLTEFAMIKAGIDPDGLGAFGD